jgi:hypothetical protein
MLTNLLPGIRDIRTPLATGYLWLLTLWLWIPSHFKHVPPTTGVPGDITRLAQYSTRVGVGIAISFAAYLIGILSKALGPPLVRLGTLNAYLPVLINARVWGGGLYKPMPNIRSRDFLAVKVPSGSYSRKVFNLEASKKTSIVTARLSRTGIISLEGSSRQAADVGIIDKNAQSDYYSYLVEEVPRLGNALVGREPELYSVYDRLISEYEFRIGIGAPLIALIVTLTARWSLLWLLALLPVLVLLATGSRQRMAGGDLLADAVRLKRIDVALPRIFSPRQLHVLDQS